MTTRIAIFGFGRIGRNIFRTIYDSDRFQVVAVADVIPPENMEYHLKFDTTLGRFPAAVSVKEGHLYAAGRQVRILTENADLVLPWKELDVDIVVESSARRRTRAELQRHFDAGAKRVVLCSPPAEPPDRLVVMGVNDDALTPADRIVSNGSCTLHAIAPVAKMLDDAFGIERASMTVVHAYTNQQRLADVPAEDMRRGRAAAQNIIPQESQAPALLEDLLPSLRGKISGAAMNVPVGDGSVVDFVAWHRRKVSVEAINEVVRTAASTARWRQAFDYETEAIVSSDVIRSPSSGTFDSQATMVLGEKVSKTLTWFDNGWGYAHRAVALIDKLSTLDREVRS